MEENNQAAAPTMQAAPEAKMKFCRHCGGKIPEDAVICTLCGRQVEEINQNNAAQPQIVIHNDNINTNTNTVTGVWKTSLTNSAIPVVPPVISPLGRINIAIPNA